MNVKKVQLQVFGFCGFVHGFLRQVQAFKPINTSNRLKHFALCLQKTDSMSLFSTPSELLIRHYVQIPESVTWITDDAFAGSPNVTNICTGNGTVDSWTKARGIPTLNP